MLFFLNTFFLFISFSTFFENTIIVFVFALHIRFFFHFNQDKIFFVQCSEFFLSANLFFTDVKLCCLHWYQSKWSQVIDLALLSICYSFRDQRLVWAFGNLVPLEVIMIFFSPLLAPCTAGVWCVPVIDDEIQIPQTKKSTPTPLISLHL